MGKSREDSLKEYYIRVLNELAGPLGVLGSEITTVGETGDIKEALKEAHAKAISHFEEYGIYLNGGATVDDIVDLLPILILIKSEKPTDLAKSFINGIGGVYKGKKAFYYRNLLRYDQKKYDKHIMG